MRSASIPPLRNYTCLKFNTFSHVARPRDWVLTGAFDFGELTMPVSLLLMPIRLLCEQRTGGEFREVEDDRKRTGRLFTIITGWSWRRVTDSALSQRRNFWGINNILNLDRGYIIEVKAAGGRDFRLDLSSCRRSFCSLYQTIAARSLPRYRMRCNVARSFADGCMNMSENVRGAQTTYSDAMNTWVTISFKGGCKCVVLWRFIKARCDWFWHATYGTGLKGTMLRHVKIRFY